MADSIKIGNLDISAFKVGSSDCKVYLGDTLLYPQNVSYKLVAQYSDTTEYKVECNSSTSLTQTEVTSHTTPVSSMTSAVLSDCVNRIDNNAFSGASSLTSITLDDGVRQFGNQAFIHTKALREMSFPSSLTSIESSCFRFSGIRKFNNRIPSGVTYLGSGAFADMYSLSAMTVPSSVTGSSTNLFLRDSGLTEVHFESRNVPALGADAFKNCTALIKIYIPDCNCYDSYAAQSQFSGLTDIIYGEDETKCKPEVRNYKIKRYFIDGRSDEITCNSSSALTSSDVRSGYTVSQLTASTSGLSKIEIGDCISAVTGNAIDSMSRLSSITLSNSVTTIANNGFLISSTDYSNRLHDIDLGKVKTIGNSAFKYCGYTYATNQPKLKIPKTVRTIGDSAFRYGKFNELTFENGGSCTISGYCFNECSSYSGISIATNSIKRIGTYAFYKFSGLTSVSLSGVTYLQNSNGSGEQFALCPKLKSIEIIGNGSVVIPPYFVGGNGVALTSVTLSGISEISNAYGINTGKSNASVRSLTMLDTTPPTIGSTSISSYNPTVIYVPANAVDTYKAATEWKDYKNIITAIS